MNGVTDKELREAVQSMCDAAAAIIDGDEICTAERLAILIRPVQEALAAHAHARRPATAPGVPDEAIRLVWRAAATMAHNAIVHESDRHNNDDETAEADALSYAAKQIRNWVEIDDVYLAEVRAMLAANQKTQTTKINEENINETNHLL